MRSLPFITAPAAPTTREVGNAESGILRFSVLGGLTVAESALMDELLAEKPSAFVEAAKIAALIAKDEDISLVEAFTVIERSVSGGEQEPAAEAMRIKHAERIDKVIRIFSQNTGFTQEAAVTALIRCRLDQPEWTTSDTRSLSRRLYQEIYTLYLDELDAEANETSPVSEEELGKQPPGSGGKRKRTGPKSDTTSSTSSPASTAEKASPSS